MSLAVELTHVIGDTGLAHPESLLSVHRARAEIISPKTCPSLSSPQHYVLAMSESNNCFNKSRNSIIKVQH